jgi:hypothetical protein
MKKPYIIKEFDGPNREIDAQEAIDRLGDEGYVPFQMCYGSCDYGRHLYILFKLVVDEKSEIEKK